MATRTQQLAAAAVLATAIAVPAEGLRRVAYNDAAEVITVCYGSTTDVDRAKTYTVEECKARLAADMLAAIEHVERCAPNLPVNELAAWGDAVYNMGPAIVCDTSRSTAAKLLSRGERLKACQELPKWNKARVAGTMVVLPGLTKRRATEMDLCLRSFS